MEWRLLWEKESGRRSGQRENLSIEDTGGRPQHDASRVITALAPDATSTTFND